MKSRRDLTECAIIAFLVALLLLVLGAPQARADKYDEIWLANQLGTITVTAPGVPFVWAVTVDNCGTPVGVLFTRADGIPQWVPVRLARREDSVALRRLSAARQVSHINVCNQ